MNNLTLPYWILIIVLLFINYPFVFFVNRLIARPETKVTYKVPLKKKQIETEIKNSFLTTPIHAVILAVLIFSGILKTGSENPYTIAYTFLITFFWTEIWHYFSHLAMHLKPLHFIHLEHHKSMVTNPWSSVSFSFLEKLIFSLGILGFMAFISNFLSISVWGIGSYYMLYFYTNTLGHANFEFRKPKYYESFMGKIFNTPSYHAMHHARYIKNYGLLTPFLDKLFNTIWEDYSEVQTRASESNPLISLREKG